MADLFIVLENSYMAGKKKIINVAEGGCLKFLKHRVRLEYTKYVLRVTMNRKKRLLVANE